MKLIDADLLEKKCKQVDDMTVKEFIALLKYNMPEVQAITLETLAEIQDAIVEMLHNYPMDILKPAYFSHQVEDIIKNIVNQHLKGEDEWK